MEDKKEQAYAKSAFNNVAQKYDEIAFFKDSAEHVSQMIFKEKGRGNLDILDVACGTGNVVLACASFLKDASFDAIDISSGMLAQAKKRANEAKIDTITFMEQDITTLSTEKAYDVITCSYALFFLPDAPIILQNLYKILKKEGILIFTSFLEEAFSPSTEILLRLLKGYGSPSALAYDMNKWENLKSEKDIKYLCACAKIEDFEIKSKEIRYGLTLDGWWELLNNTGYKGMLVELKKEDYDEVKKRYYEEMSSYQDEKGEVELIADSYFVMLTK